MNGASGESTTRQPEMTTIFGLRVPTDQVWMVVTGIAAAALLFLVITFILMPSGFTFLAAKNASGLLGYMGLFTAYMFGFVILSLAFFGTIIGILYAVYAR